MGSFICRQPNGLLCRFSTVLDTVTHYNMTDEEYIQMYILMKASTLREEAEDVIKNHLKPFEWIDDYFVDNNMTEEEFERIKTKMREPKVEKYEPDESELNDISAKNNVLVEIQLQKKEAIQWIPTSEREPKHTGDYLVTMGINYDGAGMFDYVRVASYNIHFGWSLYEKNDIHTLFGEITAWAELPKKYS